MQTALESPLVRFLVTVLSGRIVDALLNTPAGRRFIAGISGADSAKEHRAVVRDYSVLATTLAINFLYRPPEAERTPTMPIVDRGRINWQRLLEVTAEFLLVLGPLLKLVADYSRSRQHVSPDKARG